MEKTLKGTKKKPPNENKYRKKKTKKKPPNKKEYKK